MRVVLCSLAALLGACAPLPPRHQSEVQPPRYVQVRAASAVDKAMLYLEKVQAMDEAQRQAEARRLEAALASGADDSVRLHYALLLLWLPQAEERPAAIVAALETVEPRAFGRDAPLVAALRDSLRQGLEIGQRRLRQAQAGWERTRREQSARIGELEDEIRRLQAQIDALKAIERSIQQRMNPP